MYFSELILDDLTDFVLDQDVDANQLKETMNDIRQTSHLDVGFITYEGIVKAIRLAYKLTGDECLGLHLGERIVLKVKNQVDAIMMSGKTLKDAFNEAVTYSKMISDALESHINTTPTSLILWFSLNPEWALQDAFAVRQIIDVTLVCADKSILMLSGKTHNPDQVCLNYKRPKRIQEYYRVFDCRILFDQEYPSIQFSREIFHRKTVKPNLGLLSQLKEKADVQLEALPQELGVVDQVKKHILQSLPKRLSVKELASILNLSSRTLQRNLHDRGTSFKTVEKDVLTRLAKNLISENDNLNEVSYMLGFSESSSFIRFFRNEMDVTPGRFRKMHV